MGHPFMNRGFQPTGCPYTKSNMRPKKGNPCLKPRHCHEAHFKTLELPHFRNLELIKSLLFTLYNGGGIMGYCPRHWVIGMLVM